MPIARADRLSIRSNPPGAVVEINGVNVGTTPLEKEYPGGYFRRTKTVFGSKLEHPLTARISLSGFATKEIALTEGPMEWIGVKGTRHGEYWLFKSSHFEVTLDSISVTFTGSLKDRPSVAAASHNPNPEPELSLTALAERAKPAVVQLKGLKKAGSGFFVTDTGVIATNAHVAREEESLLVLLASGAQLEAQVVYVDPELDIALVKVPGDRYEHLPLAPADTVLQGETVVAIGNPGDAMQFSMTRGIVSAVGRFPSAGPGTWVQTDAPINPGNSGGPLVNLRGEVVGMNTQKLIKKNVTGIGFALSASDLLEVLRKFYPVDAPAEVSPGENSGVKFSETEKLAAKSSPTTRAPEPQAKGTVKILGTEGAQVFVDDRPVGDVPSVLILPEGRHHIRVTRSGFADFLRIIDLSAGSTLTLHAEFSSVEK